MSRPKKVVVQQWAAQFKSELQSMSYETHYGGNNRNIYSDSGTTYKLPNLQEKSVNYSTTCSSFVEIRRRMLTKMIALLHFLENSAE